MRIFSKKIKGREKKESIFGTNELRNLNSKRVQRTLQFAYLEGVPYASSSPCTWLMRAKMSSRLFLHSCIIFTYTGRNTQECTYVFLSNICMLGIRKSEHLPYSLFLFFLARSHSLSLPPSPNRAFVFFSYFSHWKKSLVREEKCLSTTRDIPHFLEWKSKDEIQVIIAFLSFILILSVYDYLSSSWGIKECKIQSIWIGFWKWFPLGKKVYLEKKMVINGCWFKICFDSGIKIGWHWC